MSGKSKKRQTHNKPARPTDLAISINMVFGAEACGKLGLDLRELFRTPAPRGMTDVDAMQRRWAGALMKLHEFIRDSRIGEDVAGHFAQLASAFYELPQGIHHPMLEPKAWGNRPPDRTDIWLLRSQIVVAIEFLMASKLENRENAISLAARHKEFETIAEQRASMSGSILSWRTTLKGGKCRSVAAQSGYEKGKSHLGQLLPNVSPANLRRMGITLLESAAAKLR